MSRLLRPLAAALLIAGFAGGIDSALTGIEQRPAPAAGVPAPTPALPDDVRRMLAEALASGYAYDAERLPPNVAAFLAPIEKEFERSPSLFTLLDYGLVLEGAVSQRDSKRRPAPPVAWSDPRFTRLRERLVRYTAARPVPSATLPRRAWWMDAEANRPVITGNSKRKEAYLEPASPSLFKSDVDVFAFGGVPFLTRRRDRLEALGTAPGQVHYTTRFEPQMDFPTIAPLLGVLAPLVEMMKVQGAGTVEILFDKPRVSQEVIGEWSALVDTGSGTFVGAWGQWPVFAITHGGLVQGSLTRVVSNGTHCSSGEGDDFYAQFAFDRPLPKSTYAIVQTGARFDPARTRITTARALTWFARPSYEWGLWYADLDGDGRQDIAVTVGGQRIYYGEEVFLAHVYANINGRWKLLFVPDVSGCT